MSIIPFYVPPSVPAYWNIYDQAGIRYVALWQAQHHVPPAMDAPDSSPDNTDNESERLVAIWLFNPNQ